MQLAFNHEGWVEARADPKYAFVNLLLLVIRGRVNDPQPPRQVVDQGAMTLIREVDDQAPIDERVGVAISSLWEGAIVLSLVSDVGKASGELACCHFLFRPLCCACSFTLKVLEHQNRMVGTPECFLRRLMNADAGRPATFVRERKRPGRVKEVSTSLGRPQHAPSKILVAPRPCSATHTERWTSGPDWSSWEPSCFSKLSGVVQPLVPYEYRQPGLGAARRRYL